MRVRVQGHANPAVAVPAPEMFVVATMARERDTR